MQSNIHAGFTTGYLENSVPMFPQTAVPAAILALQSQAATVVVVEVVVVVVVNTDLSSQSTPAVHMLRIA